MEHSNHSEHGQDGMGQAMQEGHRGTGAKDDDHTGHHAHMAADFRKRFWISLVLTLPILVLSPLLQKLVGLREAIRFPGDIYVLFSLSSAVFWYGGRPFLKGLFKELKSRQPGMMTLVAVAITTTYVYSGTVVSIVQLSRATYRKMIQNLIWATGYNIVAIPLAAGALYAWGVLLSPALGAVLMSASTVIVAINARILKLKAEPQPEAKK